MGQRPVAPVAEVQGVSKRFGATHALDDVSLVVGQGESHALVGRNGAGKSTLVSVLTGLTRPDRGAVLFGGQQAPSHGDREGWRERVACVYQQLTLLPDLTVAENLFVNAYPHTVGGAIRWRALRARAREVLDQWGIDVDPDVEIRHLRVEERQQVEIARALASGSRFLILDEPTARLEAPAIRRLFERIATLRDGGVSILFISHHLDEVYEICDTVTVLRDGQRVRHGPVADIPKAELVGAMVGEAAAAPIDGDPRTQRSEAKAASPGDGVVLEVEGLALEGWCSEVSFDVRRGEVVGLAGLAGSGKAQVAEAIAGLRRREAGSVRVDGAELPGGDVQAAIEYGVGFVPQDRHAEGFASNLSIEENMTLTVLGRLGRLGIVSPRARRRRATATMKALQVVASGPAQQVAELSGGNQQKVVVGRALQSEPRVLVVVSPTAGVDIASKEALFRSLTSSPELGVLVVSDELDELDRCDRVLVMFDGRLRMELATWDERELVGAMEGVEQA